MSDQMPNPSSDDAAAVFAALKDLGSGNYAALAKATGLSKIAVSAAITELRKRGLVNSESGGKYSAADGSETTPTANKSSGSNVAEAEEPPPPPPPPPESSEQKPKPSTKSAATSSGDDAAAVLAALNDLGSGNYAALANATGLSKIAVSSAITELSKRGLVNSESGGNYSPAGHTPQKSEATPPTGSLATDLEKLAALRESGALTAAEYSKAKQKLLDTN